MDIEVRSIIFKSLTHEQIGRILDEMEELARYKCDSTQRYYLDQSDKTDMPEEFEEIVNKADWKNFLPVEYYSLKRMYDEQERRKTG